MTTPKASHLVERVAEKLLRSGSLDQSSAQLLQSPGRDDPDATLPPQALQGAPQNSGPESIGNGVGPAGMNNGISQAGMSQAGNSGGGSRRSSLFAPPQAEVPADEEWPNCSTTWSGVGVFDEAESFVGDIGTGSAIARLPRPLRSGRPRHC